MLVNKYIGIDRVISGTWKNFFFSVITCTIAYYINEYWFTKHFEFPAFITTILGTALAFFIGFNNNQAYDRWWEARKIWGSIVNNSRTFTRNIICYINENDEFDDVEVKEIQERMVKRHIAFLYLLKDKLRDKDSRYHERYIVLLEQGYINRHDNRYNALLEFQADDIQLLLDKKVIDGFKYLELNKMLTAFTDDMGASERIKNTVFPTTYNYYSKFFIWIFVYAVTLTIGYNTGLISVLFGSLIGYIFFTIQALGSTLLNPFDDIPTGIPLNQITRTIEINLLQMLEIQDIPEKEPIIDGDYVM